MNPQSTAKPDQRLFRVDRFLVPRAGRDEFVSRIRETHAFLRRQKGFLQDFLLERPDQNECTTIMTIAIWEDPGAVEAAKTSVAAWRRESGFDPQQLLKKLGIQGEIGVYAELS